MKLKLLAATALALAGVSAPANAGFILSGGLPTLPVATGDSGNNFLSELTGAMSVPNGMSYVDQGASLTTDGPGWITFYLLAAESGYTNSFWVDGVKLGEENNEAWDDTNDASRYLATVYYDGTSPMNWAFTTSGAVPGGGGVNANLGQEGFGFFMDALATGLTSNTLYIGYDDQNKGLNPFGFQDDDNHDDFVLKAVISPVPESATWAMLLSGFAVIGAAMRRRTSSVRRLQAV